MHSMRKFAAVDESLMLYEQCHLDRGCGGGLNMIADPAASD